MAMVEKVVPTWGEMREHGGHQEAGDAGEHRAQAEGDGEHEVHVDAQGLGDGGAFGGGAHGPAEIRLGEEIGHQQDENKGADKGDEPGGAQNDASSKKVNALYFRSLEMSRLRKFGPKINWSKFWIRYERPRVRRMYLLSPCR